MFLRNDYTYMNKIFHIKELEISDVHKNKTYISSISLIYNINNYIILYKISIREKRNIIYIFFL